MVVSQKRNTTRLTMVISNSIYIDMCKTVLALDSAAATGDLSSNFTIELYPGLLLARRVSIINWHSFLVIYFICGAILLETTIYYLQ